MSRPPFILKVTPSRGRKGRCQWEWSALLCAKSCLGCKGVLCTDREEHSASAGQHLPFGSYAPSGHHSSSGQLALAGGRDWRAELGKPDMQRAAPASTRGNQGRGLWQKLEIVKITSEYSDTSALRIVDVLHALIQEEDGQSTFSARAPQIHWPACPQPIMKVAH